MLLSDGTRVELGDLVGTLHWWNEHLPHYSPNGPDLGWACAMRDQVLRSLRLLADYVEIETAWREIRALRGEAALSTRLGILQVQRVAGRYGFERVPADFSFLRRLHAFGESFTLWSLTRAFHPAALARQPFGSIVGWGTLVLPIAIGVDLLDRPSAATCIGLALALFGSALVIGIQIGTARHFRISAAFGLLFACGYSLAALIACHSVLLRYGGRVTWKGWTYDFHRKHSPGRS